MADEQTDDEFFSDDEIDKRMKPWLDQVDKDYAAALEPLAKALPDEGPGEDE